MPSSIKKRNMWVQVLLYIITLSTYSGYWFYVTSKEMSEHLGRQDPARPKDEVLMWTLLLCLPPFSLYSMYKQGELFEIFTSKSVERWLILLLWIFFPPAVWFIIQRKLNETAA